MNASFWEDLPRKSYIWVAVSYRLSVFVAPSTLYLQKNEWRLRWFIALPRLQRRKRNGFNSPPWTSHSYCSRRRRRLLEGAIYSVSGCPGKNSPELIHLLIEHSSEIPQIAKDWCSVRLADIATALHRRLVSARSKWYRKAPRVHNEVRIVLIGNESYNLNWFVSKSAVSQEELRKKTTKLVGWSASY